MSAGTGMVSGGTKGGRRLRVTRAPRVTRASRVTRAPSARLTRRLVLGILCVSGWTGAPAVCLAQNLEQAAGGFATRWAAGDVSGLQTGFSQGGVRIQWEARPLGALSPRRAGASIREYLENREAVSARVSRTGEVGGDPPRGFAELRWESRVRGTTETVTRTVFVAFVYEDGTWRVAELRVLPQTPL